MKVSVAIPVLNEEKQLAGSIAELCAFLGAQGAYDYEIVIADNGSADRTLAVANSLAQRHREVRVLHLDQRGRGRALKGAWGASGADILSYMDVDLSTGLEAFPLLVAALASGNFDLAVGSRLSRASRTRRGWRRELLSRGYNQLVKRLLGTKFSDAQCGFKAITREAARRLLPVVEGTGWFFDTELLVLAEKLGYRICDLPVSWLDDPDSRVKVLPTA